MKCADVRHALALAFDDDREPDATALRHMAQCASCQVYAERLQSVHAALLALPLEQEAADLDDQTPWATASERAYTNRPMAWGTVVGAILCMTVLIGWRFPLPFTFAVWSSLWSPVAWELPALHGVATGVIRTMAEGWHRWAALWHNTVPLSSSTRWGILSAATALWIVVNGYEAYRTHSRRPLRSRRDS